MAKLRVQKLIEELELPIKTAYALGQQCDFPNGSTAGRVFNDEAEYLSATNLQLLVTGLRLDPDKTPLSALFDFGTGYRARKEILLPNTATGNSYTVAEVAKMADRSLWTVRTAADNGFLVAIPDVKPRRFSAEAVAAWIREGRKRGNTEQELRRIAEGKKKGSRRGRPKKNMAKSSRAG